jgi:hypothetical protein
MVGYWHFNLIKLAAVISWRLHRKVTLFLALPLAGDVGKMAEEVVCVMK